jgi:hypothetical protein
VARRRLLRSELPGKIVANARRIAYETRMLQLGVRTSF